jgi:hypothetical protein
VRGACVANAVRSLLATEPPANISLIVTPHTGCRRASTRLGANRFGADSRVLRLDGAVSGLAEGIRRKIFFAW